MSRETLLTGVDLRRKAGSFYTLFHHLRDIEKLRVTDTRRETLADKRKKKRITLLSHANTSLHDSYKTGPPAPLQTDEEISEASLRTTSISDPTTSSVGKELFYAANERQSEMLGNVVCRTLLSTIFSEDPPIDWVRGRKELPIFTWNSGYALYRYDFNHLDL